MAISLILLNTSGYLSSHRQDDGLFHSPATIIITPAAILYQWIEELEKFAPELKVLHFTGIKTVSAKELMKYDIVICSIETLRVIHL
jgi:SNF2 family DNA or RNA helicase